MAALALVAAVAVVPTVAYAGGGPQNAVVIVDPTRPESLYLGNYYRAARGIPDRNVIFMSPGARDYAAFASYNLDALFGTLANRALDDHVDYVVVAPGPTFNVSAPGLVTDNACPAPITRLSISSAYSLAFSESEILGGKLLYNDRHRYYGPNDDAIAFDSRTAWYNGSPSTDERARRLFIGFLLGYTGEGGNTVQELTRMIDRGVQADGSRPDGTFYLMRTDDPLRSGPREITFARVASSIQGLGGKAEVLDGVLPSGRNDVMGVITGYAWMDIDNADMTLLAGSYADHLTSYAATFEDRGQTKVSRWIAKGASASAGAVEEPCNGAGKFPNARILVWYLRGLSLGEALLRSNAWTPFQTLYYGDPLARPYAMAPSVTMLDLPDGEIGDPIRLTPWVRPAPGNGAVARIDLYVDGAKVQTIAPGRSFVVDPYLIGDGTHVFEAVATDDTAVATQGRWRGRVRVNALGRRADLSATPSEGDLRTVFQLEVQASGAPMREIRLLQGARVIAAAQTVPASFRVPARLLGAGPVDLTAVAEFDDGRLAFAEPVRLAIAYEGDAPRPAPGAAAPVAHGYTADVLPGQNVLLDLPATDADGDPTTSVIERAPAQAPVESAAASFLLRAPAQAIGTDELVFRASDGASTSEPATIRIRYCTPPQISAQPSSTVACAGSDTALRVVAAAGTLAYQWYKDGEPIPGAHEATLALHGVGDRDVGAYRVAVTRMCGQVWQTVESDLATLALSADPGCRVRIHLPIAGNSAVRP